jgi:hypothetical protein
LALGTEAYVGTRTHATPLIGVVWVKCPGVQVEAHVGYWLWRVDGLTPLPRTWPMTKVGLTIHDGMEEC